MSLNRPSFARSSRHGRAAIVPAFRRAAYTLAALAAWVVMSTAGHTAPADPQVRANPSDAKKDDAKKPDEKKPAAPTEKVDPPIATAHEKRIVEGWTVQVDKRLLEGADEELGVRALRLLGDRLYEIKLVMPADKLKRLQEVRIWLDRTHGKLTAMQYHPSAGWLKGNGYTVELEKVVHIPRADQFANPRHHHQQPWAVMHELAHAYHDQVLDFEHAEVKAAWEKFKASGKYESVLHIDGRPTKHYALTNQKEFFAEMSESYFGLNDFYPFHRAELRRDEPEIFSLLEKIWGKLP